MNKEVLPGLSDARVMVVGGAGFVGRSFGAALEREGVAFHVVDNFSVDDGGRARHFVALRDWDCSVVDVTDRTALRDMVADYRPTHVVHLASRHFVPACNADPLGTLGVNTHGTAHVVDVIGELTLRPRLVFVSSAAVYAPHTGPLREDSSAVGPADVYGMSKLLAEQLVMAYTGDWNIVRLFNVFGSHDPHAHIIPDVVRRIRAGETLSLGNLHVERDFVHVGDVAEALLTVLLDGAPGESYNIGSGTSHPIADVVSRVCEIHGYAGGVDYGDSTRLRRFDNPVLRADISKARALGWMPERELMSTLHEIDA